MHAAATYECRTHHLYRTVCNSYGSLCRARLVKQIGLGQRLGRFVFGVECVPLLGLFITASIRIGIIVLIYCAKNRLFMFSYDDVLSLLSISSFGQMTFSPTIFYYITNNLKCICFCLLVNWGKK